MKPKKKVTSEDIRRATAKFLKDGGIVRTLPDQVVVLSNLVGAKHGSYESPLMRVNGIYTRQLEEPYVRHN